MASNNALNQNSPNFTVNQITINNSPVVGTDGTNKSYVDMISAGFSFKNTCIAGTTGALTATYANGSSGVGATLTNAGAMAAFSVDGVSPALNARILVKNQASSFQNGIYTLTTVGDGVTNWVLTRATDYDTIAQIQPGNIVPIESGTVNASTFWIQTATVGVIGTDAITFTEFFPSNIPLTFSADSGSAVSVANAITMHGGNNIATSATGSTVTFNVSGTTNHNVQIGSASGSLTSVAPSATSGVPLISQGATADPAFGTAVVAGGGTGAVSFTSNGVLIGNSTSAITATLAGTTGQVLTGVTGSAPTFQAPAASSITITGDTGGGLTGNSFTFTGGTTGLSFGGAGTTETLTFAGITANGGTVSLATDATTSTINIGTGAGVKTSTFGSTNTTSATTVQSGSGALNVTSTNGALTINSGTGALGISTDASATTVSFATGAAVKTVTLGSTNTTSATSIKSGSGNVAINSGLTIDSSGRNKNTVQPCFSAYLTATTGSLTGDGTLATVVWNATRYDQNSNFNTGTGTFTAPVTGKYLFTTYTDLAGLTSSHTQYELYVATTARSYLIDRGNPWAQVVGGGSQYTPGNSVIADMTAADTCIIQIAVYNGTKVVTIASSGDSGFSAFTGTLLC